MTINDYIADFLRDGQGRIAHIAIEIDDLEDGGGYRYDELLKQRREIIDLMAILYVGDWYISDGYNHIQYGSQEDQWTEKDLISEIQSVRYRTEMNEMPFINFTAHYPLIIDLITGGSGSGTGGDSLPTGNYMDILVANMSGIFTPQSFSNIGGMLELESIGDYFTS